MISETGNNQIQTGIEGIGKEPPEQLDGSAICDLTFTAQILLVNHDLRQQSWRRNHWPVGWDEQLIPDTRITEWLSTANCYIRSSFPVPLIRLIITPAAKEELTEEDR